MTMKIRVLSDLHIPTQIQERPIFAPAECDVVVVAGDVYPGSGHLAWLRAAFEQPIIAIAGNHEFYGGHWVRTLDALRVESAQHDVHFLEDKTIVLSGVRFIGATLWTDFKLDGEANVWSSKQRAASELNDYTSIKTDRPRRSRVKINPGDTVARFEKSRAFIETALATPFEGKTVVVTHHLPHSNSIPEQYAGDPLNPAYASDLSDLIETYQPALWIHGHTHGNADYRIGDTRVVCNPKGYVSRFGIPENFGFDPDLVIELPS